MDNLKNEFGQIYDKYIERIYRFIFLKVNSQEIAEDLASDTFLRGWKAFQKSQSASRRTNPNEQKIENIQAFLYKIARNLVIDHYREKGKAQIISADYIQIVDPRTNLEEKAILSSDINTIRLALVGLKENHQNMIIWHYLEHFSIADIAGMLGKSEGAIRVMLHRALKTLKNELN